MNRDDFLASNNVMREIGCKCAADKLRAAKKPVKVAA